MALLSREEINRLWREKRIGIDQAESLTELGFPAEIFTAPTQTPESPEFHANRVNQVKYKELLAEQMGVLKREQAMAAQKQMVHEYFHPSAELKDEKTLQPALNGKVDKVIEKKDSLKDRTVNFFKGAANVIEKAVLTIERSSEKLVAETENNFNRISQKYSQLSPFDKKRLENGVAAAALGVAVTGILVLGILNTHSEISSDTANIGPTNLHKITNISRAVPGRSLADQISISPDHSQKELNRQKDWRDRPVSLTMKVFNAFVEGYYLFSPIKPYTPDFSFFNENMKNTDKGKGLFSFLNKKK